MSVSNVLKLLIVEFMYYKFSGNLLNIQGDTKKENFLTI